MFTASFILFFIIEKKKLKHLDEHEKLQNLISEVIFWCKYLFPLYESDCENVLLLENLERNTKATE